MTRLRFPDRSFLADLGTFVLRAKAADEGGAVRLQAHGEVLAVYVQVLPGSGLMGEGVVLGLRTLPLAVPSSVDATVSLASVADRLAHHAAEPELAVPPVTVSVPWAAMAPPRSGWERVGALPAETLTQVARAGIAEVAAGVPKDAGGAAVAALRRQVWARLTDTTPPVPGGAAFAAHVLGFAQPGTELTVYACGRWTRLTSPAGHVLLR